MSRACRLLLIVMMKGFIVSLSFVSVTKIQGLMSDHRALYSNALLRSLEIAPLLVGNLTEARAWRESLSGAVDGALLNFEQKLGHLYEDGMEVLIRECEQLELLAKNLQISDASGRTLGEMDFLIRELGTGCVFQLELAVKFYLAIVDEDGVVRFPGPDPRDNWINKLDRMRARQLRLSETAEARAALRERFGVEEIEVRQRIYGVIFDHIAAKRLSDPPCVGKQARRGRWLYVSEFSDYYDEEAELRLVPKILWPVLLDEAVVESLEPVSGEELKSLASERCVLFWDEKGRDVLFLVSDKWPRSTATK